MSQDDFDSESRKEAREARRLAALKAAEAEREHSEWASAVRIIGNRKVQNNFTHFYARAFKGHAS